MAVVSKREAIQKQSVKKKSLLPSPEQLSNSQEFTNSPLYLTSFEEQIQRQPSLLFFLSLAQPKTKHFHSSYIFSGPQGIGKKTAILSLFALIACNKPSQTAHCGQCFSCQKLQKGIHPDFIVLTLELGGLAQQVENLLQRLRLSPHESHHRFIIFNEADKLSMPSAEVAANRLLKTLEEPVWNDHFFFITSHPYSLLPTILSRSQLVQCRVLDSSIIFKLIENKGLSLHRQKEISLLCEGSIQKALELLDVQSQTEETTLTLWFKRFKHLLYEKNVPQAKLYELCQEGGIFDKEALTVGLLNLIKILQGEFLEKKEKLTAETHIRIINRLQTAVNDLHRHMPQSLVIDRIFQ